MTCPECGCPLDLLGAARTVSGLGGLMALERELASALAVTQWLIQCTMGRPGVVQEGRLKTTWRKAETPQFRWWDFRDAYAYDPDIGPLIERHTKKAEKTFFKVEFV